MKKKEEQIETLVKVENFIETNKTIEKEDNKFEKLMFIYSMAAREIQTKMENIKEEYSILYNYELIDHIKVRIKSFESIIEKMRRKKYKITYKEMIEKINDIAGIRIICPLKKDVISVKELIQKIPGINVLKQKDYITHPKESGYSSYHMIIEIPVILSNQIIYVKVEIQIRTMAMDFWASLEHRTNYKPKNNEILKRKNEWIKYAKILDKMDNKIWLENKIS